jgi:hypothetical protein
MAHWTALARAHRVKLYQRVKKKLLVESPSRAMSRFFARSHSTKNIPSTGSFYVLLIHHYSKKYIEVISPNKLQNGSISSREAKELELKLFSEKLDPCQRSL